MARFPRKRPDAIRERMRGFGGGPGVAVPVAPAAVASI